MLELEQMINDSAKASTRTSKKISEVNVTDKHVHGLFDVIFVYVNNFLFCSYFPQHIENLPLTL